MSCFFRMKKKKIFRLSGLRVYQKIDEKPPPYLMYQSARVVVTKYHRMGHLNNRNFSHSQDTRSPKSRCCWQVWLVLRPLLALQAVFSLYPHLAFPCTYALLGALLLLVGHQFHQGPTFMTLFNPNYLLKGPLSKYSHSGGQGFNP